jgi:pantoate--beta-alanine ligase
MFAVNFNKITMQIFYGNAALIDYLKSTKSSHSTIGFVPTMGALHQILMDWKTKWKANSDPDISMALAP